MPEFSLALPRDYLLRVQVEKRPPSAIALEQSVFVGAASYIGMKASDRMMAIQVIVANGSTPVAPLLTDGDSLFLANGEDGTLTLLETIEARVLDKEDVEILSILLSGGKVVISGRRAVDYHEFAMKRGATIFVHLTEGKQLAHIQQKQQGVAVFKDTRDTDMMAIQVIAPDGTLVPQITTDGANLFYYNDAGSLVMLTDDYMDITGKNGKVLFSLRPWDEYGVVITVDGDEHQFDMIADTTITVQMGEGDRVTSVQHKKGAAVEKDVKFVELQ